MVFARTSVWPSGSHRRCRSSHQTASDYIIDKEIRMSGFGFTFIYKPRDQITMDVTYREGRTSRRARDRNGRAWFRMMGASSRCRFCGHDVGVHRAQSGQPFFWRTAAFAERGKRILRYSGRDWALKRQAVDQKADMIELFCKECAAELGAD